MKAVTLIFPHQLFKENPALSKERQVCLVESPLFFGTDKKYPASMHRQKLMLHRASMKAYEAYLKDQGFEVSYLEFHQLDEIKKLLSFELHVVDPTDFLLEKWLKNSTNLKFYENPNFLNSPEENKTFFSGKKKFFMKTFYEWQRRRFNILMQSDGQPTGGKFSFDAENRKKLPKEELPLLPSLSHPKSDAFSKEAYDYVDQHFSDNLGQNTELLYPWTHSQAIGWLELFLKERLSKFGPYEDSIEAEHPWIYHSVLTPMLNVGLLTPRQILNVLATHLEENPDVPLASLEGFVRQIIGWREFMRHSYEFYGVEMRRSNHWNHKKSMPQAFYTAETGIEPIDTSIRHILETGYAHHIERLMVLGGFMFLCEINPKDIYLWFTEMFIDSYDWVMVPNVYAMSQNSAGGLITTKPYFSGSGYVRKMSHYPKGDWCDVWDGLYWRFIHKHHDALQKNPRWSMMCSLLKKMDQTKLQTHLEIAENYLKTIH